MEGLSFEDWWKLYPRKVGKLDAAKAYAAAIKKGYTHDELLLGIRGFNQLCLQRGTDRTFIPHPGTWLRAGRWQDEETKGITGSPGNDGMVRKSPPLNGCGTWISRRLDAGSFSAYFDGCEFTETSVICPSQARADYIINKFRHKLPDLIVEVRSTPARALTE